MSELFEKKRQHLKKLTDEQLYEKFWELTDKITEPLIDLAKEHTSPSIERSVLLRMGFSSFQSDKIVNEVVKAGLLGKGAGNVILKLAKKENINYLKAGQLICDEKSSFSELF